MNCITISVYFLVCYVSNIYNTVTRAEDDTIKFIKEYIDNEHKPTQIIYSLCWNERK